MPMKRHDSLSERVKRLRNIVVDDEPITFKAEVPPPGSDEALLQGCICSPKENFYGQGWFCHGERQFLIAQGCPLHDPENNKEESR